MKKQEKKYSGYGYHGGGRKKLAEPKTCTISISGTKAEIEAIREKAKSAGKSVSRYVLDAIASC